MADTGAGPAFAVLPQPPYYAVIFSSRRHTGDPAYEAMASRMVELASQQPGFLGVESARDAQGFGITVSYWRDQASVTAWKNHPEHRLAQQTGQTDWYQHYETRVAKVERAYSKK